MPRIIKLQEKVSSLPEDQREIFTRIFDVGKTIGKLVVPESMKGWVEKTFGGDDITTQDIVKISNRFTFEAALFNAVRAKRPMVPAKADFWEEVNAQEGKDPFCHPYETTPEDTFGRIKGENGVTASNVAKYDGFHGLVVFNKHNPLDFSEGDVMSYLRTAQDWIRSAYDAHPKAYYPLIIWNCLWKAGASLVHGHMQMLLGTDHHYGYAQQLRAVMEWYKYKYNSSYIDDWFRAHEMVGLGAEVDGGRIVASLTPMKEKEVDIIAKDIGEGTARLLSRVLMAFKEKMHVTSFNVAILIPPLEEMEGWDGFPYLIRIVDRGDLSKKPSDVGAMELLVRHNVIAADPYSIFDLLALQG